MEKDIRMDICITGHRPASLDSDYSYSSDIWTFIAEELARTFEKINPKKIITGMALGVDTIAAEVALAQQIPYVAAIPFVGQEKAWPKEHQDHYKMLLDYAAEIVYVEKEAFYAAYLFQKRNEWMVDRSDLAVAVWNGMGGGTKNCVNYAMRQGVPVWRIDPITRKVGRFDGSQIISKQTVSI